MSLPSYVFGFILHCALFFFGSDFFLFFCVWIELKILVTTIIQSLRGLADVMLLLMFLFAVFAIIGVQEFQGALHQQCFSQKNPTNWKNNEDIWVPHENFCRIDSSNNGCPEDYPYCLDIAPNPDGYVMLCFI